MSGISRRGIFLTFEGGEGCGKSTQIALLEPVLFEAGLKVEVVREPGGTRLGERVRDILLDPASTGMTPVAELLLYQASRAQLVTERILPMLSVGSVVLCDRFTDSTLAYQGYGRGLPKEGIETLSRMATCDLVPNLTIVLDIDPALGLVRAARSGADRLEAEQMAFHERVRQGFLELAKEEPARCVVIDASGSVEEIHTMVLSTLHRLPVLSALMAKDA